MLDFVSNISACRFHRLERLGDVEVQRIEPTHKEISPPTQAVGTEKDAAMSAQSERDPTIFGSWKNRYRAVI
jgi:hypothetical protein